MLPVGINAGAEVARLGRLPLGEDITRFLDDGAHVSVWIVSDQDHLCKNLTLGYMSINVPGTAKRCSVVFCIKLETCDLDCFEELRLAALV